MNVRSLTLLAFLLFSTQHSNTQTTVIRYMEPGILEDVEIIVDVWGIPHIYAQNEADLFYAQGYYAARDRLFQFEIWRRQATGTVSEILGPRELKRDIGSRLFQFRGDMQTEMNHYHPRGDLIIESYVRGVNAYIEKIRSTPEKLPIEFKLLGILPQHWTPEIVISRHQGLLGNINRELRTARLVHLAGEEVAKDLNWYHPMDPDLSIDPKIDQLHLFEDVLELYNAFRDPVSFLPEDLILSASDSRDQESRNLADNSTLKYNFFEEQDHSAIGSNNWVVDGRHTESGYPMMANDPHRTHSVPSLRYMAHLNAPGWNVIGGGEPEIPGISIGHNEYGAWGLTVFGTDGEDLYVYRINPDNPDQYWYRDSWESMKVIRDTIKVKDAADEVVDLKYTRHGPVCYVDENRGIAYAVRCAWLEVGGAPYLASLRMNQSQNFEQFREACHYSHIPGENMVWADRNGHIGYQAVGIAPIRRNWSGMVPVPGDGSYEWEGYLPITAKPGVLDPEDGMFYTANANVTPANFLFWDAIGFNWSDPYREDRVAEMLRSGRKHSLADMAAYQTDYLSIPARQILPLLQNLHSVDSLVEQSRKTLLQWDFEMLPGSFAAGIYNILEQVIKQDIEDIVARDEWHPFLNIQLRKIVRWLWMPDQRFGDDPIAGRDRFLLNSLEKAVDILKGQLGQDIRDWTYGQTAYKHILIEHPLSNAVNDDLRDKLNVGPAPRGGNLYTVNNSGSNDNQSSGASFRMIVDTEDWDSCLGSNTPGQSGDPDSPFYENLFDMWAKDKFFPVFFSREKVEGAKHHTVLLEAVK